MSNVGYRESEWPLPALCAGIVLLHRHLQREGVEYVTGRGEKARGVKMDAYRIDGCGERHEASGVGDMREVSEERRQKKGVKSEG